jgi:hypothetical protein
MTKVMEQRRVVIDGQEVTVTRYAPAESDDKGPSVRPSKNAGRVGERSPKAVERRTSTKDAAKGRRRRRVMEQPSVAEMRRQAKVERAKKKRRRRRQIETKPASGN